MTTRKPAEIPRAFPARTLAAALALAGCATSGPLHVYSLVGPHDAQVADTGNGQTTDVPSFLEPEDQLTGFAYDPFTDHFFLRLAPGHRIRVVDRPARAIKREFEIDAGGLEPGGDLALRPRDGHLFLLAGDKIVETSRLGKVIRSFPLAGADGSPVGIAHDARSDRLLVLAADGRRITVHDPQGVRVSAISLAATVGPSLAFDSERREIYAPLPSGAGGTGVFDEQGRLVRTLPGRRQFVDLGLRSFVRVF